ncbi:Crp/Fnr family transcriptional regulator [Polaribacter uvawellassae]|uniref:Crp/Fnr family transcriptional regulator n=1 Tax=Polaribacter uvawellassae TaxID=3133495 RepID=UPI00321BD056
MDFIETFVNQVYPLSDEALNLFKSTITEKSFSKNETFVSIGEIPTKFYLLKKGVARSYVIDERGKEHIRTLFVPITTSGSLAGLIKKKPSDSYYGCLTDCEFLEGDYYKFVELAKENHELTLFHVKILENVFLSVVKRINELSTLNATERYLKLKKDIPEIENLIQQYHIASYLSITAVQLSRIRKELYSK